ncbi:hypothetical protein TgHK011_006691 [Trichoderma gracile]|nr:hypothetical protein TgHK011_006691 [Trichoderma gracile]
MVSTAQLSQCLGTSPHKTPMNYRTTLLTPLGGAPLSSEIRAGVMEDARAGSSRWHGAVEAFSSSHSNWT